MAPPSAKCGSFGSIYAFGLSQQLKLQLWLQGIKFRLQLVRTRQTGWGVISWDMIPSGAFVAIYYGKVGPRPNFAAHSQAYTLRL